MAFEKCSFKQSYRVKKKGVTKETKMIKQTSQCIVQEIGISIQQKCKEMLGDTRHGSSVLCVSANCLSEGHHEVSEKAVFMMDNMNG